VVNENMDVVKPDPAPDAYLDYAFHELSTPLTVLYSYAQMALESLPDDQKIARPGRYLTKMLEQGDKTVAMLNEFLEATRLLCHTMKLDKLEMSPVKLLQQILAEKASDQIVLEIAENAAKPLIAIDAPRLKEVFEHVIDFIFSLNQADSTMLQLKAWSANNHLIFSFQASSLNFNTAEQQTLFDFYRPLHPVNEVAPLFVKAGKTGMGLYIAHGICRLHGGDLVYNAALPGFQLSLPL
jgi:signal transduction histidine kinase